jgi:hypothetical protein
VVRPTKTVSAPLSDHREVLPPPLCVLPPPLCAPPPALCVPPTDGAADQMHGEWLMMLSQAMEMRTMLVILDGIDEAAGRRDAVTAFVRDVLIGGGFRVVCTSRPGAHLTSDFIDRCVLLNLEPMDEEQQKAAAERQLKEVREKPTPPAAHPSPRARWQAQPSVRHPARALALSCARACSPFCVHAWSSSHVHARSFRRG